MAEFVYNIFISVFRFAARLASPWNIKAKKWREGRKDIFGRIRSALEANHATVIWMHCSSVGEFEQGRPLIEPLRSKFPNAKLLITFFSPSGYEAKKNYPGADFIFYLPMDSKANAKQFLDIVQPALILWVKYEYWYYFLKEARNRNIPCLLISAVFRKEQSFFKSYGKLQREMAGFFSHLFVQTAESAELLKQIGITNCTVSGDTRFDRVIEIAEQFEPIPLVEKFLGGSNCIVAGSTWKEDEEKLKRQLDLLDKWQLKLIVAPHEIDHKRLAELKELYPKALKYSELAMADDNPEARGVLIIDNIGMLSRLYRYGYICYIGGGFTRDGVHNVLEAAVFGKPVLFGPQYGKYREAVELINCSGGQSFSNADDLHRILASLLSQKEEYVQRSEASKNYVLQNKGATQKILGFIQEKRLLTS